MSAGTQEELIADFLEITLGVIGKLFAASRDHLSHEFFTFFCSILQQNPILIFFFHRPIHSIEEKTSSSGKND